MSSADRLNNIIGRLLNNRDQDTINATYRDWADSYDKDLDGFGYVAPEISTSLLAEGLGETRGPVFDAGCGTGRCGLLLAGLGFDTIDGVDFSPEMLSLAQDSGAYRRLEIADLSQRLDFPDNTYQAVLSVGVYRTLFKDIFMQEALRILEPQGLIVMTCRSHYFEADLAEQLEAIVQSGQGRLLLQETRLYMTGQDASAHYIVLQKS
jgi:SAM-dependent methyltransferase